MHCGKVWFLVNRFNNVHVPHCRIYLCKQWTLLKTFTDHAEPVTGVRFGKNAAFIASVSLDRSLKYFGN